MARTFVADETADGNPEAAPGTFLTDRARGNWIRLRTMILLRWFAIGGQIAALLVAQWFYGLDPGAGLSYLVVGASIAFNLIATFVFPRNKRLSENENLTMALFDLLQLAALLYLTGGLHNPFAILVLGPVTISATVLTVRAALAMGVTAVVLVTLLAVFYIPLRTEAGAVLEVPRLFVFGNWAAIVIALVFLGVYSRRVTSEMHSMSDALVATQMALAREQKLTDLGGVIAATAHELGTPLATITLTSAELAEELQDRPDLREDAALIRAQADRCRDILHSMGRAGKDDPQMRSAPLSEVIREAAEPHQARGRALHRIEQPAREAGPAPMVQRRPEIIHGLRNLVQNAVDFAEANIWIEARWTDETVSVRIADDGPGFPPHLFGRIGDPFMPTPRRTRPGGRSRPGYEGMGLGLFIAKTLLERTGAELSFANGPGTGPAPRGALVEVAWPRSAIRDGPPGA